MQLANAYKDELIRKLTYNRANTQDKYDPKGSSSNAVTYIRSISDSSTDDYEYAPLLSFVMGLDIRVS